MSKILLILTLLFSLNVQARILVKVRGYNYSPFVELSYNDSASGATLEIIHELNRIQSKYLFDFYPTTSKRRYRHFSESDGDIMFFEDISWGWQDHNVESSDILSFGGEKFITSSTNTLPGFFSTIKDKKLVGVLGFHYSFANFISDESYLRSNFQIRLTNNPHKVIDMILKGRGEVGVISESLLNNQFKNRPNLRKKIRVSKSYDQKYFHRALVRKDAPISTSEMNHYIKILKHNGFLKDLFKKYGIKAI